MKNKILGVLQFIDLAVIGLVFTFIVMPVVLIASLFGAMEEKK